MIFNGGRGHSRLVFSTQICNVELAPVVGRESALNLTLKHDRRSAPQRLATIPPKLSVCALPRGHCSSQTAGALLCRDARRPIGRRSAIGVPGGRPGPRSHPAEQQCALRPPHRRPLDSEKTWPLRHEASCVQPKFRDDPRQTWRTQFCAAPARQAARRTRPRPRPSWATWTSNPATALWAAAAASRQQRRAALKSPVRSQATGDAAGESAGCDPADAPKTGRRRWSRRRAASKPKLWS